MFTIKFGSAGLLRADDRESALRVAHALAQAGYGVHVLNDKGELLPWRLLNVRH